MSYSGLRSCRVGDCRIRNYPQLYWAQDPIPPTHIVNKLTSRTGFTLIMKFLHVSDLDNEDPQDKIAKIRPLYTAVLANWRCFYYPHKHITIDEGIIKFTG